jgi:hypothetical protein
LDALRGDCSADVMGYALPPNIGGSKIVENVIPIEGTDAIKDYEDAHSSIYGYLVSRD